VRIAKAGKVFFAISKCLNSKALTKERKLRLYMTIIRPTFIYGFEVWTTSVTVRRLKIFNNKIWRMICGPICDTRTNEKRRKFNKEL